MSFSFAPIHVCKMEVWTFPDFESDFVTCKNSFNSSFHLLKASDKFSWSNSNDLDADNPSISDLVRDK